MAQTPYNPAPSVMPSTEGTPSIRVNTPGAAFGAGIGQGLESIGGSLGEVGNKFSATAMEFKRLEMENNVNQAVTKNIIETGKLDNDFRLLQGKDAQDQIEGHVKTLQDTREANRSLLQNDYEKKMYDRETMRRFGYDVVNASGYAATQFKQYTKQTREATQLSLLDRATKDPFNTKYFDDVVKSTIDSEAKISTDDGDSKDLTDLKIQTKVGRLAKAVSDSMAKTNPDAGKAFLDKLYKEGKISNADYIEGTEKVKDRAVKYYSTLDARILSGGGIPADHPVAKSTASINKIRDKMGWGPGSTFTPENIYRLVQQESAGKNLPPNQYGYAGYFQMKPSEFGLTPTDFKNMSFDQQLELYAGSYLKKYGYSGSEDLGVMNAAPSFKDSPDTAIAYPAGSREAAANPAWVKASAAGGAVTVGGIKTWAESGGAGLRPSPEVSLPEIASKAADRAKSIELFKDDPIRQEQYTESLLAHAQRNANLMRSQLNQQKQASRNAIDSVLYKLGGPQDRGPTSYEEAEQRMPGFGDLVAKAMETNPGIVKHVQDTFNYNAKMDVAPTPERIAKFDEIMKLSYGLAPGDREKFLGLSAGAQDLPRNLTQKIIEKQFSIQKQQQDTLKLNSALHTVSGMLGEAKIFNSPTSPAKQATYNTFVGGYLQKLEEFEGREKRWPNEKEQIEIAAPMIRKIEGSWIPWQAGRFSFQPPPDKVEEIKRDFQTRTGRPPTSLEIGLVYQRMTGSATQ